MNYYRNEVLYCITSRLKILCYIRIGAWMAKWTRTAVLIKMILSPVWLEFYCLGFFCPQCKFHWLELKFCVFPKWTKSKLCFSKIEQLACYHTIIFCNYCFGKMRILSGSFRGTPLGLNVIKKHHCDTDNTLL